MEFETEKAHEEQVTVIDGERKIRPQPEFILSNGKSVTDVRDCPEVILRTDRDGDKMYRVECHAVKNDEYFSEVAQEHSKVFDSEKGALEYGSKMLGEKIPTASEGVINEINFTEIVEE
jgi:hypothetical protein